MPVVVPEPDDRLVGAVFVAQDAECGGAQEEQPPVPGGQAEPSGGQDPEEVAVAEQEDLPLGGPEASDHPVGPGGDLLDRLAAGTAVAEEVPSGILDAECLCDADCIEWVGI